MIGAALSRGARVALKAASRAADRLRPPPRGVVILLYHRVGAGTTSQVDLPVARFDEQMATLAETRRVVTLDRALDELSAPTPPPDDPVVITFDDGTADLVEHAMPVLVAYELPATLYLATDWVERSEPFWGDGAALSWAALRDAVGTGLLTVGSHTHRHRLLDRLDAAEVGDELDRSTGLIADRLGVEAQHFAYPKALPGTPAADAEVRRRFRSAAVGGTAPNEYGRTDPHALRRSPIQVADGMRWFGYKAEGGLALEDRVRRRLDRRRYATAQQ